LLAVLISFALKKYWEKWPKVKFFALKSYWFIYGGLFRVFILFYYPLSMFSVYQLSLHNDCWVLIFLASFVLFSIISYLIYCSYIILKTNKENPSLLSEKSKFKIVYSSLYSQFKDEKYTVNQIWFILPQIISDILRAITVGSFQRNGLLQLIGIFLIELILLAFIMKCKPYKINSINFLQIGVLIVKVSITILLFPFCSEITITPMARIVITLLLVTLEILSVVMLGGILLINIFDKVWKVIKSKYGKKEKVKNNRISGSMTQEISRFSNIL